MRLSTQDQPIKVLPTAGTNMAITGANKMKMKSISTKILLGVVGTAFILPSCKKYDDGPSLSLRSKKARIANTWKIESATVDGSDATSSYDDYELELTKSGSATLRANYTWAGTEFQISTSGTWDLINNNEDLRLDFASDDSDQDYRILRLKEKELWLKEKDDDVEVHLMPK